MRKSTRILSLVLSVVMLVGLVPMMSFSSSAAFNDPSLKFDANGEFTLIQISDIQDNEEVDETTLALISKAMTRFTPDMVVLTGDNVTTKMGESQFKSSVDQFLAPIIAANVRYAVTFGNHDSEGNVLNPAYARQSQYNYYVSKSPLAIDFDENSLTGVGTGAIPIYSNDGSRVAFCVFPMDSGDYDSNGDYNHVSADQNAWYESESARLKVLNNNNNVPTLVFQHIPVPEIYDTMLTVVPSGTAGSVAGTGQWSSNSYILNPNLTFTGVMKEGPCPSAINGGQYTSWRNTGNMVGAFFGHDHTNTFMGTDTNGIVMGYCKAATLNSYNDGDPGLRVFTIHDDGTYESKSVAYSDLQVEEAGDYEHDTIAGTPTVPNKLYVGAADNSLSKQEYGSSIQLQSVNHKTQALYTNDLEISIDLANSVTNVAITPQSGISVGSVKVTAKDENTNTYSWMITGGTASAGTAAEFAISYDYNGTTLTQYAYSYVDNIKSPAGYYVFTRLYRGGNSASHFCTNMSVMTVLGDTVYGNARANVDDELWDTYDESNVGNWTNANAGYYNYLGSDDGGFITKDLSYGLIFTSPSRLKIHNTFTRFVAAGKSPQATVYTDTSNASSINDLGVSVNFWRWGAPDNGCSTDISLAFKNGDVGYTADTWNSNSVAGSVIGSNVATKTLANAKGSNANIGVTGAAVPADGTVYSMVAKTQTDWMGGDYDTTNYTYLPVLFSFVTYDKAELRTLLNAERTAMRQPAGYSSYTFTAYQGAYKEAYKQINKTNTTQADINAAYSRLTNCINNLSSGAAIVSENSEYAANVSVPSRVYVAGANYGLTGQPEGTNILTQLVNYQTKAMVSYTNFTVSLPENATSPSVTVSCSNGTVNFTWDPDTKTGVITGGTATAGSVIRYNFTYKIGDETYTQTEASIVANAPGASGWLTYIRRKNDWGTNQGCQQTINYFAIAGVPAAGIGMVTLPGASGNDGASRGVNLTNFVGTGTQEVDGTGICSWTGPSKYNTGTWYCGQDGANSKNNADGRYRAAFNLYFDPSAVSEFSQANLMYQITSLKSESDFASIDESSKSVLNGAVAISDASTYSGITFGTQSDTDAIISDVGDSYYRMMQGSSIPANGQVLTLTTGHHNNYKNDLTCKYGWTVNVQTVDKSSLRALIATEDELYRQIADGYDDSTGTFTAYLTALANAKAALQDVTLNAAGNEAAELALQNAIYGLTYLPADYSELRAKVDSVRITNEDPETNQNSPYSYRPFPTNDPTYFATNRFYPWSYYRSTNEVDIPINNINWNLDIRFQKQIDDMVDTIDIGWESVYLNNANYAGVDAYLLYKEGVNDATGSLGGNTIRVNPNKYGDLSCSKEFIHWSNYTTASYQAWEDAVIAGLSNRSLKSPDQPTVDGYTAALQAAYDGLTLKSADYSELDALIAEVNQNTTTTVEVVDPSNAANNFTIPYYAPAYIEQINAATAMREDGIYIVDQSRVDELYTAIDNLYVALGNNLNNADYTFANAQKAITAQYEDNYTYYYTPESWAALTTARAAIRNGKMSGEQGVVNAYALNIYNARNALAYNPADYTQVNHYLELAAALTSTNYTNWTVMQAAIDAVVTGKNVTEQAAVDTMAANLQTAYEALVLKDADYSGLQAQLTIAAAKAADQALYTTGSYSAFNNAYTAATTVNTATPRYNILQQATVDTAATNLSNAIGNLVYLDATIQPLSDAMIAYSSVDQFSYEMEYGETVWTNVQAAYNAAEALMTRYDNDELDVRDNQTIVSTANNLNTAVANLPALYQPLTDAKAEIPADLTIYTDDSVAALNNVLGSINYNLKIGDQDTVYTYADAVYEAVGNLIKKTANLAQLIAAITAGENKIDGIDTTWYTDSSWTAYENAYNAAVDIRDADPAYDITAQADIDAATSALTAATAGLAYLDADYTNLNTAKNAAAALIKANYTDASWTASGIDAAIATANSFAAGLKIDSQAAIDAAATALTTAIDSLDVKDASLTDLIAAITAGDARTNGISVNWFTTDSYAAYTTAYNNAVAIRDASPAYLITEQATVDAAASALTAATTALSYVDANYAELTAAIAAGDALDKNLYTDASWAASNIEAVLAAAKAVPAGLKIDQQGTIDTAKSNLNAAIALLELKPTQVDLVPTEESPAVIDTANNFIYGLVDRDVQDITDLVDGGFCDIDGEGYLRYTYSNDENVIGTGTKVELFRTSDNQLMETYYVVIFGDNNGDGLITLEDMTDFIDYYGWNDCAYDYEDNSVANVFALDIDGNGMVTMEDLAYISDYIGWNIDSIPQNHIAA